MLDSATTGLVSARGLHSAIRGPGRARLGASATRGLDADAHNDRQIVSRQPLTFCPEADSPIRGLVSARGLASAGVLDSDIQGPDTATLPDSTASGLDSDAQKQAACQSSATSTASLRPTQL